MVTKDPSLYPQKIHMRATADFFLHPCQKNHRRVTKNNLTFRNARKNPSSLILNLHCSSKPMLQKLMQLVLN